MTDLAIGQTVQLGNGGIAIIRYIGRPHFAPGEWVGVEILEGAEGKNDGSVQGERYFECAAGQGMFMRAAGMSVIDRPPPAPRPTNGAVKKPARPSSVISSGVGRRMSSVPDPAVAKRMSMNSASPSPTTRSRPSSTIRVGLHVLANIILLIEVVSHKISNETIVCSYIFHFHSTRWHALKHETPFNHNVKATSQRWGY